MIITYTLHAALRRDCELDSIPIIYLVWNQVGIYKRERNFERRVGATIKVVVLKIIRIGFLYVFKIISSTVTSCCKPSNHTEHPYFSMIRWTVNTGLYIYHKR